MARHLKGKSVNTSVPSIAVRFNASAQEVEEVYQSEDETSEPTNSEVNKSAGDVESSPLRYLPRLGKRSASTDNSLASSPTSDPWKFFAGIKGKITKNIEDTITEIKQRNQESDCGARKLKETKDNLSDSEDISESSISKTCGPASTTEGVEMSSDEDSSSLEKDKKSDGHCSQSEQQNTNSISKTSSGLRQRIKIIKKGNDDKDSKESLISLNALGRLLELQTGINPGGTRHSMNESIEVESGVEALEDNFLQNESSLESKLYENNVLPEQLIADVTDKVDNLRSEENNTITVELVTGVDIQQSYVSDDKSTHSYFAPEGFVDLRGKRLYGKTWLNLMYSFRRLLFVICFIILYIFGPIPVYFSGFIAGAVFTASLITLYYMFTNPTTTGYTSKPIAPEAELLLTMPEIKEHIPIIGYEGWMNEYPDEYNPLTYHVSETQTVYVKLQGNFLRISHTRAKIPKRAMWNEPKHKHVFVQHRIYNLLGAKIMLLPEGLHKKRHWSKKYPIFIILSKDQLNFECPNSLFTANPTDDNKEQSLNENSSEVVDKNLHHTKRKTKKKIVDQPQIYSKLTEENLDLNFERGSPEPVVSELELNELDSLAMKLSEDLHEDDDHPSQSIMMEDGELPEEEIINITDWNMDSPSASPINQTNLYLFGRTGREKEDWFRRFVAATHKGADTYLQQENLNLEKSAGEIISETLVKAKHTQDDYLHYMSQFVKASKSKKGPIREDEYLRAVNVLWLNAVIGRVLYDWAQDANFTNMIREKIHKKLMTIRLPYFIEQLSVQELSLGNTSPLVHNVSKPSLDQRGLWVDLDMSYRGNIVLTLQTKLNLMKLKDPHNITDEHVVHQPSAKWQSSDVEDTAESSTDDEENITPSIKVSDEKALGGPSTKSKKLMRVVDKITESKFFQAATENRYIKRAMEGVSNTDLSLKVELKGLIGTLVLNVPPPPTDRLWIGFRPTPKMYLTAQPMVGVRNMSFIRYLTNWIEKKLCKEFQKLLVIPNMEDFSIPNMSTELPK